MGYLHEVNVNCGKFARPTCVAFTAEVLDKSFVLAFIIVLSAAIKKKE